MSHELSVLAGSDNSVTDLRGRIPFRDLERPGKPEAIKGFFVRLYEIFFLGIADREAYDANKEQREKDEEYKRNMKKKK